MADENSSDKNVEMWKVKKLIKSLQAARGNGTSMISLIIPPGDQVSTSVLVKIHSMAQSYVIKSFSLDLVILLKIKIGWVLWRIKFRFVNISTVN